MDEFSLKNNSLFNGVDEQYIEDFLSSCDVVEFKKGECIITENEVGDNMYLIETGKVQISVNGKNIRTVDSGALIGELCVFGQKRRAASVFAEEDCKLLKIKGEDFRIRIYSKELDALLICYNIAKELSARFMDLLHR
jgi:CRP/FNR family cyclic AMP-dependent transcriptional regulator